MAVWRPVWRLAWLGVTQARTPAGSLFRAKRPGACLTLVRVGMTGETRAGTQGVIVPRVPPFVTSRLLRQAGLAHAFSTVEAGDMKDAPARAALANAVAGSLPLATLMQVHGARCVWPGPGAAQVAADAALARAGLAVGVFTADCVPLLIADPEVRLAAAVHAGWRGTIANIAAAAVAALVEAGARPERLVAALGPRIGACCYEVDAPLAQRFAAAFGEDVVRGTRHLDLGLANSRALERAGLRPDHVELLDLCTSCAKGEGRHPLFFSYRRDHGHAGRQLSLCAWTGFATPG